MLYFFWAAKSVVMEGKDLVKMAGQRNLQPLLYQANLPLECSRRCDCMLGYSPHFFPTTSNPAAERLTFPCSTDLSKAKF